MARRCTIRRMTRRRQDRTNVSLVGLCVSAAAVVLLVNPMNLRDRIAALFAANYEGKDLRKADFAGKKLARANFRSADLSGADLSTADLRHTDFRGSNLTGARLVGADFSNALLDGATIAEVVAGLEVSTYRQTSFRNTNVAGLSFHGLNGSQNRRKKNHLLDPGDGGADMS